MKKIDYIIFAAIAIIAIILRLYKIDAPLSDYHSWRQADTSAVSRNFVRDGISLLQPKYDDLSSLQTGSENTYGLRMVEFPIYNLLSAFLSMSFPAVAIEVSGRLVSIIFSIITLYVVYYLAKNEIGLFGATFAGITYATLPFMVFFSRVVLPETTAVGFAMLSILFLYKGLKKNKVDWYQFLLSILFFSLAVLTKPTAIFYIITIGVLLIAHFRHDVVRVPFGYMFAVLSLLPFLFWRIYITNFPEGIPANSWLFTTVNTFEGPKNIFFRPAFFRWIFMERIGSFILGIYGTVFLAISALTKYKTVLIPSLGISSLAYLLTFQGGNVQHEYYQTIIFPAIALLVGAGASQIINLPNTKHNKFFSVPVVFVLLIFMIVFSYYKVKDYYTYPQDLNQIADLIKLYTEKTDKIVTDRSGDTTLLYLADRKGAPAIYKSTQELQNLGYSYIVTANKESANKIKSEGYKPLVENDLVTIFQLNKEKL